MHLSTANALIKSGTWQEEFILRLSVEEMTIFRSALEQMKTPPELWSWWPVYYKTPWDNVRSDMLEISRQVILPG